MTTTSSFERSHQIEISAPPQAVFDYVTNPRSWPEWIASSHHIDSPDRPLVAGERFHEKLHTSRPASLDWVVLECDSPRLWVVQAMTTFIGPIVIRYTVRATGTGALFTRTVTNPARPKPPTDAMVTAIDAEAATALANIKRNVERRQA